MYVSFYRHNARRKCVNEGSDLASIHSNAENAFVSHILVGKPGWTGYNDLDIEGDFSWTDHSQVTEYAKLYKGTLFK